MHEEQREKCSEVNIEGVKAHTALLRRMLELNISLSTMRRIIDPINATKFVEDVISMEKDIISLLQDCQTEDDVNRKLDEISQK